MKYILGLDIGGTKCAAVVAQIEESKITFLDRKEVATTANWKQIIDELLEWSNSFCKSKSITPEAVGISCGGPQSEDRKLILSPPNLPGWDSVPIIEYVEKKTDIKAYMENDADACALAEWKYGAGVGTKDMIFLTFGTGLGAGLILDKRLYRGSSGMAGEVGHIRLSEDGPVGYNKAGSFEGYSSGGGIKQMAGGRSAKEVIESARAGDESSLEIIKTSAEYFGKGLSIIIDMLNPEAIVAGSIYTRAQDLYKDIALDVIKRECLSASAKRVKLLPAKLGERIGDYGAVCAAIYNLEKN